MTTNDAKDRATEWNKRMATRVTKWLVARTFFAVVFVAASILLGVFGQVAFVFPCAGMGVIFGILALDACEQRREILQRKWQRLTPRPADSKRAELTPTEPKSA